MRLMKILFIQNSYYPEVGGSEIYCSKLISFLSDKGHEVSLLTKKVNGVHYDPKIFRWLRASNWKIKGNNIFRKGADVYWAWYNYLTTMICLKRTSPDVVYAHNLELIGIYPILAANKLGVPVVLHLHNIFYANYLKNVGALKKIAAIYLPYHGAAAKYKNVIAVSHYVRRIHCESGFPEEKAITIHNGMEESHFMGISENRFTECHSTGSCRILFAGTINTQKGIEDAIAAICLLKNKLPEVHLDMAGNVESSYLDRRLKMLINPEMSEHITFLGKIPPDELQKKRRENYYCALVPSVCEEAFGLVVLEAMAAGLPVVATAVGGIVEMIEDGITGKLVHPHCPDEIAQAIMDLWKNEELYNVIRKNAYKKAKDRFVFEEKAMEVEKTLITAAEL